MVSYGFLPELSLGLSKRSHDPPATNDDDGEGSGQRSYLTGLTMPYHLCRQEHRSKNQDRESKAPSELRLFAFRPRMG
jgi:hypothetical protein